MKLPNLETLVNRENRWIEAAKERTASLRAGLGSTTPTPYLKKARPKIRGETWVCLGDVHAHPNHHNRRLEWAGRLVADLGADLVWDPGDWGDFQSLCRYDIGKTGPMFEGRRYWKDLDACVDADERFRHAMGGYRPKRMIRTLGNHEDRINTLTDAEGYLYGILSTDDMMSKEFGWEVHPLGEHVQVAGITLCHSYKETRSMLAPKYPANNCLNTHHSSWLFGHDHRLSYLRDRNVYIMGVGCYFEYDHDWLSKSEQRKWSRGLTVLRDVRDGRFDPEWWSIERVEARYG